MSKEESLFEIVESILDDARHYVNDNQTSEPYVKQILLIFRKFINDKMKEAIMEKNSIKIDTYKEVIEFIES